MKLIQFSKKLLHLDEITLKEGVYYVTNLVSRNCGISEGSLFNRVLNRYSAWGDDATSRIIKSTIRKEHIYLRLGRYYAGAEPQPEIKRRKSR